jgi:hypothetical protein
MFMGVESDTAIGEIIGLTTSGYSHYKRTNTFPFDKIVRIALENNLSLDEIFNNPNAKKFSNSSEMKDDMFVLINKNRHIKLPFFRQNCDASLSAFIDKSDVYIIDTSMKEVSNIDLLLKKESDYYIKSVKKEIDGNYLISNLPKSDTLSQDPIIFSKEAFEEFEIIGSVVAQASLSKFGDL